VGDDGDVAKVHSCSSGSDNGWSAISPENRDPLFRITLKNLKSLGRNRPEEEGWRRKRKPGQKDRAYLTRCGAIYSENAKKQWFVSHLVSSFLPGEVP
jgi:hypothetical protein